MMCCESQNDPAAFVELYSLTMMLLVAPASAAELNEATIILMITVGSYQGMCNIARVFSFETKELPLKVGRRLGLAGCRGEGEGRVLKLAI
jgi:hypothetical protein